MHSHSPTRNGLDGASDPDDHSPPPDSLSHLEQALARPVLVVDRHLRVRRATAEFCSWLPCPPPLIGRPLPDLLADGPLSILQDVLDDVLLSHRRVEECILNDRQILRVQATPFYDADDNLVEIILLFEDETATCRAMQEAERSNHIQSAFLARMSHELRTPLNAIIGFTDMILSLPGEMLDSPRQRDYLASVQESGRHMLDLVENLLDITRMSSGPVRLRQDDVPLCQTMHSVINALTPHAQQAAITLDVDCPQPMPTLRGDSAALRRIVQNLLDNAIKYTPTGGRVRVSLNHSSQGLEIQVSDSGIGIHPDDLDRIFTPFERGRTGIRHTGEGAGLGLSIAKSLVLLQDGWIDVRSTLGQGTVVTVGFPRHRLRPPPQTFS